MKLIWDLAVELNAHTDPTPSETINICHNISLSPDNLTITSATLSGGKEFRDWQKCSGKYCIANGL